MAYDHLEALSWARSLTRREALELAQRSGVPFHTLQKIRIGKTRNPRAATLTALLDARQQK